ncbi:hypothetical protein C7386_1132 [Agathobaculum butyriciproducens]|nr:hypothetical protein C7386_1132 [Agathobaculum butyriciproducens]
MCSSNLSDTANMSRHGSTLCSPTAEKILCRSLSPPGKGAALSANFVPNKSIQIHAKKSRFTATLFCLICAD